MVELGDRRALSRAITLLESTRPEDEQAAEALLEEILPRTGKSLRLGISGPPGVGKSTLIDALGLLAIERGKRVAVLAIDPSSAKTGGSILGDKTRMARLAAAQNSFIRPSNVSAEVSSTAARSARSRSAPSALVTAKTSPCSSKPRFMP
ncbi:MAG TPA: hypothetical protein VM686_21525 [Polyangiaceae bacterium]|nr:hypothetical protein [Polyangiaceae bacterium]